MLQAHQAWSDLEKLNDAERLRYLRRILSNRVIDEVRRSSATRRGGNLDRSLQASFDDSSEQLDAALVAMQPGPSEAVEQSEQLMRVAAALAELSADQQSAIELHCLEGLTIAETAQSMSKTEPAVAGLVRRGLKTLRQTLNPVDEQSA